MITTLVRVGIVSLFSGVLLGQDCGDAHLCVDTAFVAATHSTGSPPPTGAVKVTNCGETGSTLGFEATASQPWIQVFPPTGTVPNGSLAPVQIGYDTSGLSAGTHKGWVTFRNLAVPSDVTSVPVTLTVDQPVGKLTNGGYYPYLGLVIDVGHTVPEFDATFIVNGGPYGSELHWFAELEPGVDWIELDLFAGSSPVEEHSSGALLRVKTNPTTGTLALGEHETVVHVRNLADPSDILDVPVVVLIVEAVPKMTVELPMNQHAIRTQQLDGAVDPVAVAFTVRNDGSPASLVEYTVAPVEPVPWLSITPAAGALAWKQERTIELSFSAVGVAAGHHEALVRVATPSGVGSDSTFLVSFSVGEAAFFLPGDQIAGSFDGNGDSFELVFPAVKTMKLQAILFSPTSALTKVKVSVFDPAGELLDSGNLKSTSPNGWVNQFVVTAAEDGIHRLRVDSKGSGFAPFDLRTYGVLPNKAYGYKKTVSGETAGAHAFKLPALPGATLTMTATPKGKSFVGPLWIASVIDPTGASLDTSPWTTLLGDGGFVLDGLPLDTLGTWKFTIASFPSPTNKAKLDVDLDQPYSDAIVYPVKQTE